MDFSINSRVGELLDNPQTKAVLDKHLPAFATDPRIRSALDLTLATVKRFSPESITPEQLAAIDDELAQCKKSFSVDSRIGDLFDSPRACAVLEKYVPEFVADPQAQKTRSITLRMLHAFSQKNLTPELFEKISDELDGL